MNGLGRKIYIYTFQQLFQRPILQRYLTIQQLSNKIALSSIQYTTALVTDALQLVSLLNHRLQTRPLHCIALYRPLDVKELK